MECVICKQGRTCNGTTTVTLDRGGYTVVIKGVPADVCDGCGEYYLTSNVADAVGQLFEEASERGVIVQVRPYAT